MKSNSVYTALAVVLAFVAAVVYTVLFYLNTVPGVTAVSQNGVRFALLVFGSMAILPLACKCENKCMCNAVKNYLPAVIVAAMGNLVVSSFVQLITAATRASYLIAQFTAVFFQVFLPVIWGLFLYEIIKASLCKCGCDKLPPPPPKDDCDNDFGYNKYKY